MLRRLAVYMSVALFLVSCAGTGKSSRLGTGKPKFASLEIEGVSYFLSSEHGSYSNGKALKLSLKVQNITKTKKIFNIEKDRLLILQIKNEYGENLRTTDIAASYYFSGDTFSLAPDEERVFEIVTDTNDGIFKENDQLSCSARLYFLPKIFRRNSLSIYLDKK